MTDDRHPTSVIGLLSSDSCQSQPQHPPNVIVSLPSVQPKTVVIYNPLAHWFRQYETTLELVERYLQRGFRVRLLACRATLPACMANPTHSLGVCMQCQSRFAAGVRWAGVNRVQVESFMPLTASQHALVKNITQTPFASLAQVQQLTLDGSDIGLAALSSAISYLREPHPDVLKHRDMIARFLRSALIAHFAFKNLFERECPDEFVVFNGRFAEVRPPLRLAQQLGIQTYVFEAIQGLIEHFVLTPNSFLHDLDIMKREMERVYAATVLSEDEQRQLAKETFRLSRIFYFEQEEKRDETQVITPHKRKQGESARLIIFNNSEDEFEAIPGWKNPFYKHQNDGIEQLLSAFAGRDDIHITLREHPNLKGVDSSQRDFLRQLPSRFANFTRIEAESKVSSYELMDDNDLVMTFGSSIGIEAAYFGKPVILMGRALYEDLNCCLRPNGHAALVNLLDDYIRTHQLPAHAPTQADVKLAALKYGVFKRSYGIAYQFVKMTWRPFRYDMLRNGQIQTIEPSNIAMKASAAVMRVERMFGKAIV